MPSARAAPRATALLVGYLAFPDLLVGFLIPSARARPHVPIVPAAHHSSSRSSIRRLLPRQAQRPDEEEVVIYGGGGGAGAGSEEDDGLDLGDWVEPWLNAESKDVLRISFNCYDEEGRMLIDPWLLSELLLETGAYSSQIEDAAKGSKEEVWISRPSLLGLNGWNHQCLCCTPSTDDHPHIDLPTPRRPSSGSTGSRPPRRRFGPRAPFWRTTASTRLYRGCCNWYVRASTRSSCECVKCGRPTRAEANGILWICPSNTTGEGCFSAGGGAALPLQGGADRGPRLAARGA